MDVDPVASMRCWAVEITLAGRSYDVPAMPAADWWPVLASGDLSRIIDSVVSTPDDPSNIDDLLLSGQLDHGELTTALRDAFEETAGRSFHVALVLATTATMHWSSINGELMRRGFRWDVMPLGAALDAIYAEITGRLTGENLDKFLATLENEALTAGKPTPRQREKSVSEFEAIAGPRPTSGVKSTGGPSEGLRSRTRTRPRQPRQDDRSSEPTTPPGPPG